MTVFRHIAAECRADRVFALMALGLDSWSALSLALLALNVLDLLPRILSAGSNLGLRARLAGVRPRFPSSQAPPDPVHADARAADLRRVVGRCPACGVPYSGFAGADTGVIQVDRTLWRAACPRAMLVDAPGACQELQAAWRPKARPKGSGRASESGRS